MSSTVLADKDVNAFAQQQQQQQQAAMTDGTCEPVKDVKSMEYHRQMLQNKLEQNDGKQEYVSPSDNIMSPCTAKLSAYRSKQVGKAKPRSLFAKTSAKNISDGGENLFGDKMISNAEKN